MDYTEIIITIFCAVLGSNGLWAFLQSRMQKKSALTRMMLGLGHQEIFRTCEQYINRGGVTKEELEDLIKYLYGPYKAMGGNGTGEKLVDDVKRLPIISAEEAEKKDRKIR